MIFDTARAAAKEALLLAQSVADARDIQWEPSHTPKPRTDTSQRASGGHGDPTGDIVLDPQRLALREAVRAAERTLEENARAMRKARHALEAAVARWNGE
ncbi:hypothetical protein PBI_DRMANHATTAN_43 [Arthrobacter phage DrManhattan]|uniref:Uncharacterized protein n=2 Tax=Manhattanvirus drmanhattan TaxID=2734250 RepID=A0A3G2KFK2_9CAUD|nr:hypothetical protein HOU48_gp43 [Arthrobacter phage DrManhattan]AYN57763.1 hypothetical protein PBI_DRMANHATTAN_43 [Arthrobacter phage DrManhattan]QHB36626.1 hypothetical protein SEA_ADOLIN_44 [Arthrobacter phage Adolin]